MRSEPRLYFPSCPPLCRSMLCTLSARYMFSLQAFSHCVRPEASGGVLHIRRSHFPVPVLVMLPTAVASPAPRSDLALSQRRCRVFGWTPKNEIGNGRWVMMGLAIGLLTEYATAVNFIDQIKLMVSYLGIADIYD